MMTAKTYSKPGRGETRIATDDGKVLIYMQEAQRDGISQPMEFVCCLPPLPFFNLRIVGVKSKSRVFPLWVSDGEYKFIKASDGSSYGRF